MGHAVDFLQYFAEITQNYRGSRLLRRKLRHRRCRTVLAVLIERTPHTRLAALFRLGVIIMPSIAPIVLRDQCLLGRIPTDSTIEGLSLSTNGGSKPYYWVFFRVRLILVSVN